MSETTWITKDEFLSRAEEPRPMSYSERMRVRRGRGKTPRPRPKVLFVGNLETLDAVTEMCNKLESFGVELRFVDNPRQASFSPELRLVGEDRALLRAIAYLTNHRRMGGDEMVLYGNTVTLWWD